MMKVRTLCSLLCLVIVCTIGLIKAASSAFANDERKALTIVFVGAPFSGKGTQADLLSARLNVPILQSGELFRNEVRSGSKLGKTISEYMNSGQLIPDEYTVDLITKTLTSEQYRNGVIMDGYPRNSDHMNIFDGIMKDTNMNIDAIIYLDASQNLLTSRIENRLICSSCSKSTTILSEVKCCDNPNLSKRVDDTLEKFGTRYSIFKDETIPMIKELQKAYSDKFIHISSELLSTLGKDELSDHISNKLSNILRFSQYHAGASNLVGRDLKASERKYLNIMYEMVESCGGHIRDGLFVTKPGVALLTEPKVPRSDSIVTILMAGISIETSLEFIAHGEMKVARLTSSKTKAMNFPLYAINDDDESMMKAIEMALKSRLALQLDSDKNFENVNMTLPAAKATFATFTATLSDLHSILIGRLGNDPGNEKAVIEIASILARSLHEKYPKFIESYEYYRGAKNTAKYAPAGQNLQVDEEIIEEDSVISAEGWKIMDAFNVPKPTANYPPTSSFISAANFNSRITYLAFANSMPSFSDSVKYVKKVAADLGHASILSAYQVIHNGVQKRTKKLFTDFGWEAVEGLLLLKPNLN